MSEHSATTPRSSSASEPARKSLGERVQAKLQNVTDERRNNSPMSTVRPSVTHTSARQPRRARLRLTRVDPWSVMKTSFLLSIAFGVMSFVAIVMVWSVLGAAGVWDSINSAVASIVEGDNNTSKFDITDYVGMSRVLGFTLVVSVLDVILLTALATLSAFLYNLAAALLGGIEVTLAEDER